MRGSWGEGEFATSKTAVSTSHNSKIQTVLCIVIKRVPTKSTYYLGHPFTRDTKAKMMSTKVLVALMSFLVMCVRTHANNAIDLIPFSLELTSNTSNESYMMDQELIDATTYHLETYIGSGSDESFESMKIVSLKLKNRSTKDKSEIDGGFVVVASFTGTLNIIDDSSLPTDTELTSLQWGAFIGQSKVDYLSTLRADSSSEFLKSVSNVKVSWTAVTKSNISAILIAIAVGIVVAVVLIAGYAFLRKGRTQNSRGSKEARGSRDLELAGTGSMSPNNTPRALEAGDQPMFFDRADSIRMGKTVATKDTIDVSTGMDMMNAWKQNEKEVVPFDADITRISQSDGKSIAVKDETVDIEQSMDMMGWKSGKNANPFDADITGITKTSPNKTLEIDLRKERGNKNSRSSTRNSKRASKSDNYLSKDALAQNNENRFSDHARRYAEKNKSSR